jgi:hypothetical protein
MPTAPADTGSGAAGATAIVAHDAGGAEVLSSYVRRTRSEFRFALQGPARAVFERKLGAYRNLSIGAALDESGRLLCGTSWQSDLELRAIAEAKARGVPSVAWLEHWVGYRERFNRAGAMVLPDELWVSDPIAAQLAQRHLPQVPVRLQDNPYFADIRAELASATPLFAPIPGRLSILYVCEPVREAAARIFGNALRFGYTEEGAMRYFFSNLAALGQPVGRILIRPHPSEPAGKYQDIAAEFELPTAFSNGETLSAEVASSDCVVGCGSMAMVIGLIAGKRVLSCIPPEGMPCPLPQPEIEMLREMVGERR